MNPRKKGRGRRLDAAMLLVATAPLGVAAQDEDRLSSVYGDDEAMVTLATGYRQPLTTAPAVSTVITADEIDASGAVMLEDLLAMVPGVHVSTTRGISPNYFVRGLFHELNGQLLVLVNGIPVNDVVNAGRPQAWTMPVQNIERVEIVRGPGSAVYGADAFAGTINVVTKSARNIEGFELGAYGGSFDTGGGWVLSSGRLGRLDAALSVEVRTTDGPEQTIRADAQTRQDALFGTAASLAPGEMNTERTDINARVDVGLGDTLRFRAGYQGFLDVGTGVGTAEALDPDGRIDVQLINADLTYRPELGDDWEVESQLSFLSTDTDSELTVLPPGAIAGTFPDGVRNDIAFRVHQARAGISAFYKGIAKHRVRLAAGFNYAKLTDIDDVRNFLISPLGIPIPAGTFASTEILGVPAVLEARDRKIWYGSVQDEWQVAPDWTVTVGVRVDNYSDFGTTMNPRASVVWTPTETLTLKALYGRAFRPPSFIEQFGNQPFIAIGNPSLDPETIDWAELQGIYRWTPRLLTSANVFYYDADDIITVDRTAPPGPASAPRFVNVAGREGYGLELEVEYEATDDVRLSGNYTLARARDKDTDEAAGAFPRNQVYAAADWRFLPNWHATLRASYIAGLERRRGDGDTRPPVEDYALLGLTVRGTVTKGLDLSLTANNLLDEDAREPSSVNPTAVPFDIPIAGRSVFAQAQYRF